MKKISKENIGVVMNGYAAASLSAKCNGVEYEIKSFLSLQEQSDFVEELISIATITDEENNGTYSPALFEFSKRFCLVKYFTNIELPKEQEEINNILFGTDIIDDISACVKYDFLVDAAKDKIQKNHEILISFIAAEKEDPLDKLVDAINGLIDNISNSFAGIDSEKITEALSIINEMNESKIVKAVIGNSKKKSNKQKNDTIDFPSKQVDGQINVDDVLKNKK